MKGLEQNTLVDQVPSVILDMYSSSIATTPANEEDDDRLVIDAETIQAIQKALETARRLETIEVLTSRKRGDRFYKVTTRATIEAVKETRTQSRYSEVVIKLMPPHDDTIMTMLTVSFGRDRSTHWITLQGNPTSTLTGQNIWPMEQTFKTAYRQKAMMLAWPYHTLLAVCRAADPKFKAPPSLVKRVMRGETTCQNLQIATYLGVQATADKTSFFALIGAGFRTPRVRARPDGTLEAFDLGQRLGIDAVPYPPAQSEDGLAPWASMMLRKRSGNNEFGTLTFYDKAAEQSLTAAQARKQGLTNLIRVDITLKKRGLECLFSAAKKLADKHDETLDLAVNANKKIIASAANVVKAIDVLDKHFAVTIQEHESKGFRAWLITEIVHRQFYLRELLGYTPKKWRRVEQWMAKWAAKDDRYKQAFDKWREVTDTRTTLLNCLTTAGLSADAATDRIKELELLGFSGDIPPLY